MASMFTKIINREIPAEIVYEDDKHIAFLDINPHTEGHTLVVPKTEVANWYDLEDPATHDLIDVCKKLAKTLEKVTGAKKVAIVTMGFGIPNHAHVHLIPINKESEINTDNAHEASPEELKSIGDKIRAELR